MTESLHEVAHVQPEGHLRKSWFAARDCELFVWEDATGAIVAFQFCFEAKRGREAVEWRAGHEVHHAEVEETSVVMKNRTHTLRFDNAERKAEALAVFERICATLPHHIAEMVRGRLT